MDTIRDYVEKVVIYVLLTSYVSVIFPDGSYKKYIRFITGAVLVAIVMKPLEVFFT